VQQWFRRDARVQATELLLQERPAGQVAAKPKKKSSAGKRSKTAVH
jgi:prophage tail gpP-like protein